MKLFLDTNVFVEFIEHRTQYEPVSQIIDAIIEEQHTACISTGSLYTLTYLFERGLKMRNILMYNPLKPQMPMAFLAGSSSIKQP